MEDRDSRAILALTIKAYNEWIDGQRLQTVVWRVGEKFPRFGKPSKDARRARVIRKAPTKAAVKVKAATRAQIIDHALASMSKPS
jgi:hypothetical protein